MIQISFKKVLIAFAAIFLMSRARYIKEFFSEFEFGGILTLEPLRNSSEGDRYIVTVVLLLTCFIVAWKIFTNHKK